MPGTVLLHLFLPSLYSQKTIVACYLAGVQFDEEHYDLTSASDQIRADELTPWGRIPVADINGTRVCESTSIIEALDLLSPEPILIPRERVLATRVRHIDRIVDSYLLKAFGTIFHHRFGLHRPLSETTIASILDQICTTLLWLDARVKDEEAALIKEVSLADCFLLPICSYLHKNSTLSAFRNLSCYFETVQRHDWAQRALHHIADQIDHSSEYHSFRFASKSNEYDLIASIASRADICDQR